MVNKMRVLLTCDDEATNSLMNMLNRNGMDVTTCGRNGVEALRLIDEVNPDVVIMDAFLQGIDALGVLLRLNERNPVCRPIITVLSGIVNAKFEHSLLQNGADYFFLKPIDCEAVFDRIVQLASWKGTEGLLKSFPKTDYSIQVSEILQNVGIMTNSKGYRYVKEAILFGIEKPEMLSSVTKILYPAVAESFNTTPINVERSIRYALQNTWDRGRFRDLGLFFSYGRKKQKPTNAEFISTIVESVLMKRSVNL